MPPHARKPLMRSLGEFVGHIWSGVKADPGGGGRVERRRETAEKETIDEQGRRVILRRTVVEEVEVRGKESGTT